VNERWIRQAVAVFPVPKSTARPERANADLNWVALRTSQWLTSWRNEVAPANTAKKFTTFLVGRMGRVLKDSALKKARLTSERASDWILTNLLKPNEPKNSIAMFCSFGAIITTGLSMAGLPANI